MRLLYGPYEPDKPPFLSQGLQAATNVYRGSIGYRPVGQFSALTTALASRPLGAGTFTNSAGTTSIIAGTTSNLYRNNTTGWTSLASGYATGTGRWRFAQFGGVAIATNGTDPMQKINLTTFTVADLGGTPPTTTMLTVVKDFLVGGVIDGVANKVQWSAINNAEGWTVGLNQCDYQILPSGGEVTGLLGGEFGIILQRGRVSRMTYVGDNLVFQFDEISNNVGCVSPHSVIQAGQMGFWLSDSGFMMWDGAMIKPIGQERIDRTFASQYNNADWASISTAVDNKNSLVAWATDDKIHVYNWVLDAWTVIEQPSSIVFGGFSRTTSLEEIGILYPPSSGGLDVVPISLDAAQWRGGNPTFYVFDTDYRLGTMAGTPMEATFETGDIEMVPGRAARLNIARPLCDAAETTLTIASRNRLSDTATETAYSSINGSGDMPVRENARYNRFTQVIPAGTTWTFAQGIDITLHKAAKR